MKNTILSENQAVLIEELVGLYGNTFTFEQVYDNLKEEFTRQDVRKRVAKLVENGWLVRLKNGLYTLSSLVARGTTSLSFYKIAQVLNEKSYVSFEAALQFHGMFDQLIQTVTSISLNDITAKEVQGLNYKYVYTDENSFYGFKEERVGASEYARIAYAEKAILDMLNFNKSIYTIDLILEKLTTYKEDFDFKRFEEYVEKQGISIQRIIGFLFDKSEIDSSNILNFVKVNKGYSRMSKESTKFDAKWRLYYSDLKINEY